MAKISKEKWKTWGNVFDEFTLRTLFKLASQGHFENLQSPVQIGKESNVFTAITENGRIIVKIYRLETCDFNKMYDYIKADPRYEYLRKQRRKIIFAWTQREFRNLMKAREAGVRCPTPIAFLNNVILMELIGDIPAPMLKDSEVNNPKNFFDDIVKNYKKLWKGGLVHADLSHFNILNNNQKPVFIDFSQCSPSDIVQAREYLQRDIRNVCNYFKKIGYETDQEKVEKMITQ